MHLSSTRLLPSLVSRFRPCLVAFALVALVAACNGVEPGTPAGDPAVRALTSPDLGVAPAPGVPDDHFAGEFLPADALPGQVPSAPWEVVLRYPPEVEATIRARWEAHRHQRGAGTTVVFLQFEGQSISYSNYDSNALTNTSWIPGRSVTIPAFNASYWGSNRQSIIDAVVQRLQQVYAGYDVQFVTTRPSSGNYMMTVIGGTASLIGMQNGVLGVSPLDCASGENLNLNPIDINFICSEDIGGTFHMSLWDLVYTIAHENAHTYGLAHINRTADIMYYATAGGDTLTWGAAATRNGEGNCSNGNYQDDRLYLTKAIGGGGANPETIPPTVAITSPGNNSTQGSAFDVIVSATDTSGVKNVELYVNGSLANRLTAEPYRFSLLGMTTGTYQLQAKATDYYDNIGSSAIVNITVPGSGPPPGCQSTADCGANQSCQNGSCVALPPPPLGGALGADCDRNEDCAAGWCIFGEQNYCTQACNEAQNIYCPAGYACSPDGFCLSATPIPPGSTGAPCSTNEQCRSNICVDGANDGYCTAICQAGGAVCPNQSACIDSGDGQTFICDRPPTGGGNNDNGVSGGGCATAPAGHGAGLGGLALLLLLGVRRRRGGRGGREEVRQGH